MSLSTPGILAITFCGVTMKNYVESVSNTTIIYTINSKFIYCYFFIEMQAFL